MSEEESGNVEAVLASLRTVAHGSSVGYGIRSLPEPLRGQIIDRLSAACNHWFGIEALGEFCERCGKLRNPPPVEQDLPIVVTTVAWCETCQKQIAYNTMIEPIGMQVLDLPLAGAWRHEHVLTLISTRGRSMVSVLNVRHMKNGVPSAQTRVVAESLPILEPRGFVVERLPEHLPAQPPVAVRGIWRHSKTGQLYWVQGRSRRSTNDNPGHDVRYIGLELDGKADGEVELTRDEKEFLEVIRLPLAGQEDPVPDRLPATGGWKEVHRFRYLGPVYEQWMRKAGSNHG